MEEFVHRKFSSDVKSLKNELIFDMLNNKYFLSNLWGKFENRRGMRSCGQSNEGAAVRGMEPLRWEGGGHWEAVHYVVNIAQ